MCRERAILIAGPTASGKSALALALARNCAGTIINADSMQVYRELRILTARPDPPDEAGVPHALYGHVSGAEAYSVGRWLGEVEETLVETERSGRTAIIVGGTGLYFKALLEGLSPVAPIPPAIRARWRAVGATRTGPELHRMLGERDPVMAERLSPGDRQRLVRALEVIDATGYSLAHWQGRPGTPVLRDDEVVKIVIAPERGVLYERCDRRFGEMIEAGALGEVLTLRELGIDPGRPIMRALGVRPLLAHAAGEINLQDAIAAAGTETRRYAKRQLTWLRRHMKCWEWRQAWELRGSGAGRAIG